MSYAFHFGPDGIKPVDGLGKPKQPVIVGDLLALWAFEDDHNPRYLIDGLEGGMYRIFDEDDGESYLYWADDFEVVEQGEGRGADGRLTAARHQIP